MKSYTWRGIHSPLIFLIPIFLFFSPLSSQEAEIILPEVTTYIPAQVEHKLVITAEMLEAEHIESLSQVMERSGIQNLSYGAYGLDNKPSIRGFTDETVRVVIDGICVNNAQYGTFDFSSVNMAAVEKIEIVRGGFTEGVEDEGAVGGVIYITTKKIELQKTLSAEAAAKTYFNLNLPLDSVFQKLTFAGNVGEQTFINSGLSLNYAQNLYLFKNEKNVLMQRKNAQVMDGQGNLSLTHYFGDGNYISVSDLIYAGNKHAPGVIYSQTPGLQRDINNNLSFSIYNPAVAGLFNLQNSLSWLCNNRAYKENTNDAFSNESFHYINTIKYTGTADFYSLAGGRFRQSIGFSADYTYLRSTNDGTHNQFSGVVKETSKLVLGKLFTGTITLSLPFAVKLCINDDKANFAFVPKAGIAWNFTYIQLTLDGYRMVQFPNMDDLFWEGSGYHGNPNLIPESGWGADFGIALRNLPIEASVIVFSNYYKDKIQWGSKTTQNLSSAFYLGVDFSLAAQFWKGLFEIEINGEYLYNRLLDESSPYTYGKRIMWTPDFVCSMVCGLNFELAKIRLSAEYTGLRYKDNMNCYFLKPYLLVNLAVEGAPIKGKFAPFLKLDNLLNWNYQTIEDFPMPGISLTVGARYKFF